MLAFLQKPWEDSNDIPEPREDDTPDVELGPLFPDIGTPERSARTAEVTDVRR